jgi:hypothetical protein
MDGARILAYEGEQMHSINKLTESAVERGGGILRLAPTWVPRSFEIPGRRLKLAEKDLYPFGARRGGIDERWLASTTFAMNEERAPDEGLSYVVDEKERFTLKDAIEATGSALIGERMWQEFHRWPVYSKFFDNLGAIPHHLHQDQHQAALVGQEGKPEGYYFPPQLNATRGEFPHTYFGLEAGTTKADIRRCLERWDEGDNGIRNYSKAYHLEPGTGWLVPPRILHAPGSLVTYEPQWGSDVFSNFQSMADGRVISRAFLVKDVPVEKHHDLDYLVDMIDWERNLDPKFKANHYIEPILSEGDPEADFADRWVVYGKVDGRQLFSAKELTVHPNGRAFIKDPGAYGLIVMQGHGKVGELDVDCPALIRFGQMTHDELFVSFDAATEGVIFRNLSATDPLVILRYFGPNDEPGSPEVGAHLNN